MKPILWVVLALPLAPFSRADSPSALYQKVDVQGHVGYISLDVTEKAEAKGWILADLPQTMKISALWVPTTPTVEEAERSVEQYLKASEADPVTAFGWIHADKNQDQAKAIKNARNEIGLVRKNYDRYQTQYIGLILDGKKCVLCNFFYLEPESAPLTLNPMERYIDVNDGGYNFWHVIYDVASRKCIYLDINGPWELDMQH